MKKFYAIIFVLLLSCSTAFAGSVFVKYNNAGSAIKYQEGAGNQQKFGKNAIYSPQTNQAIINRNRQRRLEEKYIENMNKSNININLINPKPNNNTDINNNINNDNETTNSQKSSAGTSANSTTENLENSNSSSNKTNKKRSQPKTINGVTYY